MCGDFGIPWALGAHGPALEMSQGPVGTQYRRAWLGMVCAASGGELTDYKTQPRIPSRCTVRYGLYGFGR